MEREVKLFVYSSRFGGRRGFLLEADAKKMAAADVMYTHLSVQTPERQSVTIPGEALWLGDTVTADVLLGQTHDDGIDHGGRWIGVAAYCNPARGVTLADDGTVDAILGDLIELGTERVVGVLDMAHPASAAAVRNVVVIRRRGAYEGAL